MVRSGSMPGRTIMVGERVRVPWGLDVLEGDVVDSYDTGSGRRVVVRVAVPDAVDDAESVTVALPAESVEPIEEASTEIGPPGEWVAGQRYERGLLEALERVVATLPPPTRIERPSDDMGADYILRSGNRFILVEIKAGIRQRTISEVAIQQFHRALRRYLNMAAQAPLGQRGAGLFVTNQELTDSAQELVKGNRLLEIVRWRSPHDDRRLAAVVRSLFARLGESGDMSSKPAL
jgi:hypothetical protein